MTDAIETPEPAATSTGAPPASRRAHPVFAGFTPPQLLLGALLLALAIWCIWVTHALIKPREQRIVRADLSRIVGEYVQAQARTTTPPDKVQVEMRQFMASLDAELTRRGKNGQVVLVGEAVLSKNVADVTAEVANAVFASGVQRPKAATEAELREHLKRQEAADAAVSAQGQAMALAQAQAQAAANPAPATSFGPAPGAAGAFEGPQQVEAPAPMVAPGASTTSFGGPNGGGY